MGSSSRHDGGGVCGWLQLGAAAFTFLLSPADAGAHDGDRAVVAVVEQGVLHGSRSPRSERFLGIPFAKPPIAEGRWRVPAAPDAWSGVRRADVMPPMCAQLAADGRVLGSEDCLYLNVFRPRHLPAGARLPVLVWIHGGAFVAGSSADYDASELAARTQTLVVTVNYRLGIFGFLALSGLTAEGLGEPSGNYGLLDQRAALAWVQRNIAAFGGDSQRVTIAGQSAGGSAVCAHLTSPASSGLFSAAIIQSGFCAAEELETAETRGEEAAVALGCGEAPRAADCLRELPAPVLLERNASLGSNFVIGGETLPRDPRESVALGELERVPVMIGNTRNETLVGFLGLYPLAREAYPFVLEGLLPGLGSAIAAEYPADTFDDPVRALGAATSDGLFGGCQVREQAAAFAEFTPTYLYEFDDPSAPVPAWVASPAGFELGSSHGSELGYLFDRAALVQPDSAPFSPAQERLSRHMQAAWAALAREGDPGRPHRPWPAYAPETDLVMQLRPGGGNVIVDYAEAHHCNFWEALLP